MKIHLIQGYIQSIYLVEYYDRLLLLDGCCRADINTLKQFITEKLHKSLTDLKLIVVTHMHPDHAGAAAKLRKMTGCKIATANMPKQWYSGIAGRLTHLVDISLAIWVAGRMGKAKKNLWYSPVLHPDYALNDQDSLPGFSDWCVISTPGHTDRDLSVYHLGTQKIYVGDLLVKVKDRFVPPIPVNFPDQYGHSLQKVKDIQPQSMLLAHGKEVSLSEQDYAHLFTVAPRKPVTSWTPAKNRLKRLLLRKKG